MVAVKVAILPSHSMRVMTLLFSKVVFTVNPVGVLRLSGETAAATAFAIFALPYSSVIVASKLLTLQLPPNKLVCGFNESFHLIQRNLRASSDVMSAAFAAMRL